MAFFKSSDELLEKGQDLVKQREFEKARETFSKSAEKANKEGEKDVFVMSNVLESIMMLNGNGGNSANYYRLCQALIPLGDKEIKVGIKSILASVLAQEAEIASEEKNTFGLPGTIDGLVQRAQGLQSVGVKYQVQIGNGTLFLPELFNNKNETGIQRAMLLFAISQENLAESTVWQDPKKAAEYYQNAVNYRKQIGDVQGEQTDLIKVAQYSKSASCWFCSREMTGEQVHFLPMSSNLTPMLINSKGNSPLPSVHPSQNMIYACRGCHSAISKRADEIALVYHNQAIARLTEVQNNLQAQINDLRRLAHHH
jgi:hypothetical protein